MSAYHYRGAKKRFTMGSLFRMGLAILLLFVSALWLGACRSDSPIFDWCDETNNCKDLPGTVCNEDRGWCVCPVYGERWCDGACRLTAICQGEYDGGTEAGAGGSGGGGGPN